MDEGISVSEHCDAVVRTYGDRTETAERFRLKSCKSSPTLGTVMGASITARNPTIQPHRSRVTATHFHSYAWSVEEVIE